MVRKFPSRKKSSPEKQQPKRSNSSQALDSLIDDIGVELDGRSLLLPDGGDEFPDEVSSMNSSVNHTGKAVMVSASLITQELENAESDLKMTTGVEDAVNSKATTTAPMSDDENTPEKHCLPLWLRKAPTWLQLVLMLCIALIVGSIVLVAVGASLAFNGSSESSSTTTEGTYLGPDEPATRSPQPPRPPPPPVAAGQPTFSPIPAQPAFAEPVFSTIVPTTPTPTAAPTRPTNAPTNPIDLEEIKFFVTAGRYQSGILDQAAERLQNLPTRLGTSFLVQLGDWNSPSQTNCDEASYRAVTQLYRNSSVPVYFVMGDNEYNDCSDPVQAMDLWKQYLVSYEFQYWQRPDWTVWRQGGNSAENFVFEHRNVVFAGINLVAGLVHDEDEFEDRLNANLQWIDLLYRDFRRNANMFVIFAHAEPPGKGLNADFYSRLFERIQFEYDRMRFVLVHRNGITQEYGMEKNYNDIPNLDVISVLGPVWPPLEITIDTRQAPEDALSINTDDWLLS